MCTLFFLFVLSKIDSKHNNKNETEWHGFAGSDRVNDEMKNNIRPVRQKCSMYFCVIFFFGVSTRKKNERKKNHTDTILDLLKLPIEKCIWPPISFSCTHVEICVPNSQKPTEINNGRKNNEQVTCYIPTNKLIHIYRYTLF